VVRLRQDVERAGERADVGEKHLPLAVVRELTRSMTAVAFASVYERRTP
jgi:hypothetical protein